MWAKNKKNATVVRRKDKGMRVFSLEISVALLHPIGFKILHPALKSVHIAVNSLL